MPTLAAVPTLRLTLGPNAGRTYEVRGSVRVGRHPYNDVSIPDPSASRYHCWSKRTDLGAFIEDLMSSNGTWVNGDQVRQIRRLEPGDRIRVGRTEFGFQEAE